jgi:hypothetical protein
MTDTPRYWKPLIRLQPHEMFLRKEVVQHAMEYYKLDEAEARKLLDDEHAKCAYYVNDLYQVEVTPMSSDELFACQINIRRRDGGMYKDWRHFQQIKNETVGPEREAVEVYPAESRKVDTCNKWHLWVLPEGQCVPTSWSERDVQYDENRNVPGLRQRAL